MADTIVADTEGLLISEGGEERNVGRILDLLDLYQMTEASMEEIVSHFMSQVKMEDLINVGFMKPMEISLRTHKNDKEVPNDSLPQGLFVA